MAHTDTKPAITFQFEYRLQTMFPKSLMALFRFKNSELVAMAFLFLGGELPEMKVMWRLSPLSDGTITVVFII